MNTTALAVAFSSNHGATDNLTISDVARAPQVSADPIEVFRARCSARAMLVSAGLMSLIDAVDGLQAAAEQAGIVDEIGQDDVQSIMADAFREVRR